MDPTSAILTVLTVGAHLLQSTNNAYIAYQDADNGRHHVGFQISLLEHNISELKQLQDSVRGLDPGAKSLADIFVRLQNDEIKHGTKAGPLRWLTSTSQKAAKEFGRKQETESSITFAMLLNLFAVLCTHNRPFDMIFEKLDMNLSQLENVKQELKQDLEEQMQATGRVEQWLNGYKQTQTSTLTYPEICGQRQCRHVQRLNGQIYSSGAAWEFFVWKWFEWSAQFAIVSDEQRSRYTYSANFRLSLPLMPPRVLLIYQSFWGSRLMLPQISISPQNIIPRDCEVVRACQNEDLLSLRSMLVSGRANPNDRTDDGNSTLLRYAVNAGHYTIVNCLLDAGADPNLTYGDDHKEIHTLNSATYYGNAKIIRRLLSAKANIEHVNRRSWTPLFYLWDPAHSISTTTRIEILEIFAGKHFDGWHDRDVIGWTVMHRASALGTRSDIEKLIALRVGTAPTTSAGWLPIHCAVSAGNEATFDFFSQRMPLSAEDFCPDDRRWNLLHLAAQVGSQEILTKLLKMGADPSRLTHTTMNEVPPSLQGRRLLAKDIAEAYGHTQAFESAMREAGLGNDFSQTQAGLHHRTIERPAV